MFLDFALFVPNIKRAKKSSPVLANENLVSSVGKWNAGSGPLLVVYFECQNGDTENIGILLKVVFFEVQ